MSKREDILDAAMRLFNQHGYHAVGVDWIRDEAQVSKMTLYKYFLNKEDLVGEVLKFRHEAFKSSLENAVSKKKVQKKNCRNIQLAPPLVFFEDFLRMHVYQGGGGVSSNKRNAGYIKAAQRVDLFVRSDRLH